MKTLKFDRNSWHYHMVSTYDPSTPSRNLCEYLRQLVASIIACIFIWILIISTTFLLIINPIVFTIIVYTFQYFDPSSNSLWIEDVAILGIIINLVVLLGYCAYKLVNLFKRAKNNIDIDKFVPNAYKTLKEKYCAKIEFVSGENK